MEMTSDSIVNSVIKQFVSRSNEGIKKYGTTLKDNNLTTLEWIEHAKQEAMDFILYLEKLKTVLEMASTSSEPPNHVDDGTYIV